MTVTSLGAIHGPRAQLLDPRCARDPITGLRALYCPSGCIYIYIYMMIYDGDGDI